MVAKHKAAGMKVGIKELKDRASEIVNDVAKTHRPTIITKNGQEVAKIVPIRPDPVEKLVEKGLIQKADALLPLKLVRLEKIALSADLAIKALSSDRDENET